MKPVFSARNHDYILEVYQDNEPLDPRKDADDYAGSMVCWHTKYELGDEQPEEGPLDYLINLAAEVTDRDPEVFNRLYEMYLFQASRAHQLPDPANEDPTSKDALKRWHDYRVAILEAQKRFEDKLDSVLMKHVVMLPLYLYDHSGLRMKIGDFKGLLPQDHAEFDTMKVGFIYTTMLDIKNEYGDNSAESIGKAVQALTDEVTTYDTYLSGDVYGFQVFKIDRDYAESAEVNPDELDTDELDKEGLLTEEDSCWGFYGTDWESNGLKAAVNIPGLVEGLELRS